MAGFLAVGRGKFLAQDYVGQKAKRGPMGPRSRKKDMLVLSAEAEADRGERTVEISVGGFAAVDAAIHGAEEEIGAVADADLGVGIFERQSGECTNVVRDNAARARVVVRHRIAGHRLWHGKVTQRGKLRFLEVSHGGLMMRLRSLPPEENGAVQAPIGNDLAIVGIACERCGGLPR